MNVASTPRAVAPRLEEGGRPVAPHDIRSFAAGKDAGTRILHEVDP
jgi:hypothetical protein